MDKSHLIFQLVFITLCPSYCSGQTDDSQFNQVVNVTSNIGETAILTCSVSSLGTLPVQWYVDDLSKNTRMLLTRNEDLLTYDERFAVNYHTDDVSNVHYDLVIRELMYEDQAPYRCMLTGPFPSLTIKTVYLVIQAPPTVIDELSSGDNTVQEGEIVMLVCKMTGIPEPVVTWYKLHNGHREEVQAGGESFMLPEVTRFDHGTYECSGYNGVGPAVIHSMRVNVYFAPEVSVLSNHITKFPGEGVVLECKTIANPLALATWRKDNRVLVNPEKYQFETFEINGTTVIYSLYVNWLEQKDFGEYSCRAQNQMGEASISITLTEMSRDGVTEGSATSVSETTTIPTSLSTSTTSQEPDTEVRNATSESEPVSMETLIATQMKFYKDQMMTNRLVRNMMEKQQNFYDFIQRFLEERDETSEENSDHS